SANGSPGRINRSVTSQFELGRNGFAVVPNPAQSRINLLWKNEAVPEGSLQIWSASGACVKGCSDTWRVVAGESIDISTFPPGLYFLVLHDRSGRISASQFLKL